jgi:solute carrier family 45 protein 1/2/4
MMQGNVRKELFSLVRQIWHASTNVPARIEAICLVQFWAWIGWFPFMFYGSTWVGEIYLRHVRKATDPIEDALTLVGRLGSTAMIASSTITFLSSIVLPWIIRNPDESAAAADQRTTKGGRRLSDAQPISRPRRLLRRLLRSKPTLLNTWTAGNLMFMASMLFAPTVKSIGFATFILALCGLPSAVNGLATGTFIGIEVNKLGSSLPSYDISSGNDRRNSNDSVELHILHNHGGDDSDSDDDDPHRGRGSSDALHLLHDASLPAAVTSTGELSGIYLGILNIYTTLPQLVGTAISWVVFSILEPGKSPELGGGPAVKSEGLSGIGVCLFIGAIGAGVAAGMSRRLTWIQ